MADDVKRDVANELAVMVRGGFLHDAFCDTFASDVVEAECNCRVKHAKVALEGLVNAAHAGIEDTARLGYLEENGSRVDYDFSMGGGDVYRVWEHTSQHEVAGEGKTLRDAIDAARGRADEACSFCKHDPKHHRREWPFTCEHPDPKGPQGVCGCAVGFGSAPAGQGGSHD